jgi:hypothetical protein
MSADGEVGEERKREGEQVLFSLPMPAGLNTSAALAIADSPDRETLSRCMGHAQGTTFAVLATRTPLDFLVMMVHFILCTTTSTTYCLKDMQYGSNIVREKERSC